MIYFTKFTKHKKNVSDVLIGMTKVAGVDQQRHMRSKAKLAADTDLWEAGRKTVTLDNTAERDWLLGLPDKMRQGVVEDKTNLVRWLAATRWN